LAGWRLAGGAGPCYPTFVRPVVALAIAICLAAAVRTTAPDEPAARDRAAAHVRETPPALAVTAASRREEPGTRRLSPYTVPTIELPPPPAAIAFATVVVVPGVASTPPPSPSSRGPPRG
jgi:hypothetical protein